MKFRRKPTKIYDVDAFQYDGDFMNSNGEYYVPKWAVDALKDGKMYFGEYCGVPGELMIKYEDGNEYNVRVGDYVYRTDDDGLIHSMSSKIFEKAFERVSDDGE